MKPTTSIIEQIAWEGILSLPMTLLLGCALTLLLLRSLFREIPLLGRWALGFAVLRFTAVAVVLWMLLGPTLETKNEIKTPHTIALLVDDSGSMSTQDPEEPRQSTRWAASESESGSLSSVANLDRASIAMEAAVKQWDAITTSLQLGRKPSIVLEQIEEAESLSHRSDKYISQCKNASDASRVSRIREELNHVHETLVPECRKLIKTSDSEDYLVGKMTDEVAAIRKQLRQTMVRQQRLSMDWVLESPTGRPSSSTRRQLVTGLLNGLEENVVGKFTDTLRIQRYRFAESLTSVEGPKWNPDEANANAEPKLTDLSKALEHVAKTANTDSLAAAVLFSDGGHNVPGGASPKLIAASMGGVPIHVVPVGGTKRIRDIVIQAVNSPSMVKHEDSILFSVTITGFECEDEATEIVLRKEGEEVERRTVSFQNNRQDIRETFEYEADQLGRHEFEFSVRPLEEEASEENNLALATVNVVTSQLKVLLADGRPRWEYRYLEHLFSRDSSVEFDQLLFKPRIVATGARRATSRMPKTADDYGQYSVVILGDLSPQELSPQSQSALADFVRERGGNVIITAGRDHMPEAFASQALGPLLPVEKGDARIDLKTPFTVRLTQEGSQNEALLITESRTENRARWAEQFRKQPIYFVSDYHRAKPTAHTLIESGVLEGSEFASDEDSPMAWLSWHQVGAGKVVFLSSPASYHLRHRRGDRMHHRFWGQLLRWLTSSQPASDSDMVRLATNDVRYQFGEPVNTRLKLAERSGKPVPNASVNVIAVCDDKQVASIELVADERIAGRYTGEFAALPAGAYRLIPQGAEIDRLLELDRKSSDTDSLATNSKLLGVAALVNVVSDSNLETTNTKCNHALLREIAEASGGLVVPPTAVDEILRISAVAPAVTQSVRRQPLWNRWRYLWLVVGCVFVEWFVRKSKGLL